MKQPIKHTFGFTLVEIAIVLVIIGIITAGILSGAGALRESAKFKEDQIKLQDIKTALLGYVAVNGYLPCPDTNDDGEEEPRTGNQCSDVSGTLPYIDLATHAVNSYGFAFSYEVNRQTTSNDPSLKFESSSYFASGDCEIGTTNEESPPCFVLKTHPVAQQDGADASADFQTGNGNFNISDGTNPVANNVPLVVISHGQNQCNSVTGNEASNCDGTATTYYRAPQDRDSFDDVLVWLSALEIKKAAGLLDTAAGGGGGNGDGDGDGDGTSGNYPLVSLTPEQLENADHTGNYIAPKNVPLEGDVADINNLTGGQTLKLGDDNIFKIGNQQNSPIKIDGDNNNLELTNDLKNPLTVSGKNNLIRIEGDLDSNITVSNENNQIYIGGDLNNESIQISGTGHKLYLETAQPADGNIQAAENSVEILCGPAPYTAEKCTDF